MNNWKTTITGAGAGIVLVLTFLASQPYSNGELAVIIPSEWKPYLALAGIISAGILATLRGLASADASSVTALKGQIDALQSQIKSLGLGAPPKQL